MQKKKVFAICGSTRKESVNLHIIKAIAERYKDLFDWTIFDSIDQLPHFNPDLDNENLPETVSIFRNHVAEANGVLICTPEYVYSLPGSLKNAVEWTVSTVLFTNKPVSLITASSSGIKAHEAIEFLMHTIGAKLSPDNCLLIQAPKTKVNADGKITDENTLTDIHRLIHSFLDMMNEKPITYT
jgi:NAD(P)H-dependent FMN reductase